MYCGKCGMQVSDQAMHCPNCGAPLGNQGMGNRGGNGQPGGMQPGYGGQWGRQNVPSGFGMGNYGGNRRPQGRVLFSRMAGGMDRSTSMELFLWITACVCALTVLVTIILLGVSDASSDWITGLQVIWFFMLFFTIGMGVLMIFRLRGITILYGSFLFQFVMLIPFYLKEGDMSEWANYGDGKKPIIITLFFVFALITVIALITCELVHLCSRFNLTTPIVILSITTTSLISCMVLSALISSKHFEYLVTEYNSAYFWPGMAFYIVINVVVCLYTVCFFKNIISNDERKFSEFISGQGGGMNVRNSGAGIFFVQGILAGKSFPVQGEIMIGSQMGGVHVVVTDPYVSKQHCSVRFNPMMGCYEVMDLSSNGVFLQNGTRLMKGSYQPCPRGTVIYLGSQNQAFRLM